MKTVHGEKYFFSNLKVNISMFSSQQTFEKNSHCKHEGQRARLMLESMALFMQNTNSNK